MLANILGETLPLRLSPTFLQHAACPQCLRWTYLDKLTPRQPRRPALRGQAGHLAIANLTRLCLTTEIAPRQLAHAQVRRAIAEATPHEIFSELGNLFEWISLWRNRFDLRPRHLVGYEERMAIDEQFRDAAWDDASYRGIVDVIHLFGRTAVVTDYKSQPNVLSAAALARHEKGTFYCWLVSKYYPQVQEFVFRIWYLRYGFYAETRRTRRQLDEFEETLHLKIEKLLYLQNWDPIAGEHCGVCDFVEICPLAKDAGTPPPEILTKEQAVRVAADLRVKEEWTRRARAQLKVYVEHNDPVELPGYRYGFHASRSANTTPRAGGVKTALKGQATAGATGKKEE